MLKVSETILIGGMFTNLASATKFPQETPIFPASITKGFCVNGNAPHQP
jgi:hypothetical protein